MCAADKFVAVSGGIAAQILWRVWRRLSGYVSLSAPCQGAGRTGLDTGRIQTVGDPAFAHIAFIDLVRFRVIAGNFKRTGRNAFLAADALVVIKTDGLGIFVVVKSAAGANRHTGRIGAVHAGFLAEEPFDIALLIHIILELNEHPGVGLQVKADSGRCPCFPSVAAFSAFHCLQASWQPRQAVHFESSYNLIFSAILLHPLLHNIHHEGFALRNHGVGVADG